MLARSHGYLVRIFSFVTFVIFPKVYIRLYYVLYYNICNFVAGIDGDGDGVLVFLLSFMFFCFWFYV